ncbi:MAG TPA: hypothetical protein VF436_20835 [Dyella sp.]
MRSFFPLSFAVFDVRGDVPDVTDLRSEIHDDYKAIVIAFDVKDIFVSEDVDAIEGFLQITEALELA